jgi:hypothetical protein
MILMDRNDMSRKGKRRIKATAVAGSTACKQIQSGIPGRPITIGLSAFLLIGGLIVVMTAISAHAIVRNSSPNGPGLASADQSPSPVPAAQPTAMPVAKPAVTPVPKVGSDTSRVSGGPIISFPERSFDFGTITQGTKVSHTFVVRNIGDAPLRLIKAAGS